MNERHVGGLWCHEVLERLDAFIDGELDADTLGSVQAHVAECSECAAFGAAYAHLITALRARPEVDLDDGRRQRLKRRLAEVV